MPIVVPVGTGTTVGTGITTYSGIVGTLERWLNRTDITSDIPIWIALLEARLNRLLRCPEMEVTTTLTADAERIDLPTDFLEARALYLDTDPRQEMESATLGLLRTKYGVQASGKPEVYVISGNELVFGPAPDSSYDAVLTYYQKLDALSSDNETNWLITSHPDVYLYGALMEGEAFLWNDERIPLWKSAWDEAIGELIAHANKKRIGGPIRLRPSVSE
jgi:hypothetical protein